MERETRVGVGKTSNFRTYVNISKTVYVGSYCHLLNNKKLHYALSIGTLDDLEQL